MSEWISVKDRLPDPRYEEDYLISDGTYVAVGCYLVHWVPWKMPDCTGIVTHWMPLPNPPKDE